MNIYSYGHFQSILLIAEANFSFSVSLAKNGYPHSLICTTRDSEDQAERKYADAKKNINKLKRLGSRVMFNVDATNLESMFFDEQFNCILYNFPHSGWDDFHTYSGKVSESDERLIIRHQNLVKEFAKSAFRHLKGGGELHIRHKKSYPFVRWNIKENVCSAGYICDKRVPFNSKEYKEYIVKYGSGYNADKSFPIHDAATFIFTKPKNLHCKGTQLNAPNPMFLAIEKHLVSIVKKEGFKARIRPNIAVEVSAEKALEGYHHFHDDPASIFQVTIPPNLSVFRNSRNSWRITSNRIPAEYLKLHQ